MTVALDDYLDQLCIEQQSEIAEDLYLTGVTHGYFKHPRSSTEYEYLLGYIEGLMQYNLRTTRLFKKPSVLSQAFGEDLSKKLEAVLAVHPQVEPEDCPF